MRRAPQAKHLSCEHLLHPVPTGEGVDMGTEEVHLVCPTCGADQCVACGCDWHKGSTCEQYQQVGAHRMVMGAWVFVAHASLFAP